MMGNNHGSCKIGFIASSGGTLGGTYVLKKKLLKHTIAFS